MTDAAATLRDECCSHLSASYDVVAFGGSAGGLEALMEILSLLPKAFRVPILVVQHLPRVPCILPTILSYRTRLRVKWAEHGETPVGGTVYVGPIDYHLTVADDGSLDLSSPLPHINHFKPAVDPLFESIARVFGKRAVSIVLSGMLDDGMRGSLAIRKSGGVTMAQDEASSKYFDMPCAATDLGGSDIRFTPRKIAEALSAIG